MQTPCSHWIRAIACARHSYFVPNTVVDFQKGEQQMNIEYALYQALSKISHIKNALILYDIACVKTTGSNSGLGSGAVGVEGEMSGRARFWA
ncbi:hypothetical protein ID866_12506 [Astraeus odoratus]|nr:hypothetical protein ID866_12506 [Astraeus odoratus]